MWQGQVLTGSRERGQREVLEATTADTIKATSVNKTEDRGVDN